LLYDKLFGTDKDRADMESKMFEEPEFKGVLSGDEQMKQIREGFQDGLTNYQVKRYAKPEFDDWQMKEIIEEFFKKGFFRDSLTKDQTELVKFYANPEFTVDQMHEIRKGFEHGLTKEQLDLYAKPEFTCEQMEQIRWGLEYGLKKAKEQVELLANHEFKFTGRQMHEIRCGLSSLTNEQIKLFAKLKLDYKQMEQIKQGL